MLKKISTFTDGGISATSYLSSTPCEAWQGQFDFGLVGISWDSRCEALAECVTTNFDSLVLMDPLEADADGLQDRHKKKVLSWAKDHANDQRLVQYNGDLLKGTFPALKEYFWDSILSRKVGRPARIFIDVTTCTRFLTLALLKEALFSGVVSEVVLGYSEGKYPSPTPSYGGLEELAFNDGVLQALPVPGMFGEFEPRKEKFYLISVGFDGWKTLNLIVRKEPERVAILLCSPGADPGYENRSLNANRALIERYAIYDSQIIRARAGDAVAGWKEIAEKSLENFDEENVFYMCAGNKPHSVALALRAMTREAATLLYNCPAVHSPVKVERCEQYWNYSIKLASGTVLG